MVGEGWRGEWEWEESFLEAGCSEEGGLRSMFG